MRTLIISDLHLGSVAHADVLRRADLRAPLLQALRDVDRLVLLGDVIELRHGPQRDAMAAARPFFEDVGRALAGRARDGAPRGEGHAGELVLTAGNHDHGLVEPWLARRCERDHPPALAVEQRLQPAEVSSAVERIAGWASPARTTVAYPGLWVREDVYATHGHYLDCHLTVPTLERLSVGVMCRLLERSQSSFHSVEDYEAVSAPLFAWRDAVSRSGRTRSMLSGLATASAWRALGGGSTIGEDGDRVGARNGRRSLGLGGRSAGARNGRRSLGLGGSEGAARAGVRELRRLALAGGFPLAVAALNRAGLGPLSADISADELRRAGLAAMGEVAARLGLGDAFVVFGHTHRAGPLPGDEQREWRGRGGARLVNAGSWTYTSIFVTDTPGESPYWPGSCVIVDDHGPPVVRRLLQDRTREQIAPAS